MKIHTVKSCTSDEEQHLAASVEKVCLAEEKETKYVAVDCEGVNLSRLGTVEVVSICFTDGKLHGEDDEKEVFLVDLGGDPEKELIKTLKQLFEDPSVVKIIHDCRMDCDALFHLHGIKLNNVHDTSCFHGVIAYQEDKNLNDVLRYNGIPQNDARDKNVYRVNPAFWKTRPLTTSMIEWASSDVDKLFAVAARQLMSISEAGKVTAEAKSKDNTSSARDMKVETGLHVRNPGYFIGKRGANLRDLQKRTGTLIYQQRPGNTWFVYYPTSSALAVVKRKMDD